ncbi:MAG: TolC family protein [Pseudomonadota bacterium]
MKHPSILIGPLTGIVCALLMCGCVRSLPTVQTPSIKDVVGSAFSTGDHVQFTRATAADALMNHRAKPITAVFPNRHLTLTECRRAALANNLDIQVARMDEFTKRAVEYSNRTKLLPHVMFSGDLSERDNPQYSYSDVLGREGEQPSPGSSGTGVTNFSTGHERSTERFSLEARWSPTDAALAYYLTKSSANDSTKSHYTRMRVAQKILAMVDGAYFRLLSLQSCLPKARNLVRARSTVAERMKTAFNRKLASVEDYNRAAQNLIRAQRLYTRVKNEVEKQRNLLASAMAISPERCVDGGFLLVGDLEPPKFDMAVCNMEMVAVQNRPEAFEAGLNHISSLNDLKRTVVKYLPKLSGYWRYNRDKDKFLYNKEWKEVGLSVYFDLVDWLSNAKEYEAAGANSAKTRREVGSVAVGIASQVRTAAIQFHDAQDELQSTQSAFTSSNEVMRIAKDRQSRDDLDKLALEEARANMLQNDLERTKALGETNATLAELQGAMGINYTEPPNHP